MVLGTLMVLDTGYMQLVYANYTLETSLWIGLVLLIAASLAILYLSRFVILMYKSGNRLIKSNQAAKERKTLSIHNRNAPSDATGSAHLEDQIPASLGKSKSSRLLQLLYQADHAHATGDGKSRDEILSRAIERFPRAKLEIELKSLALRIKSDASSVIGPLQRLHQSNPKHKGVVTTLLHATIAVENWHFALELLSKVEKARTLGETEILQLRRRVFIGLLDSEDDAEIASTWKKVPKSDKRNGEIKSAYTLALWRIDQPRNAVDFIESSLREHWDSNLVELYGQIVVDAARQLRIAEGWLKARPHDRRLLTALGLLNLETAKFEDAKRHLTRSIELGDSLLAKLALCRALLGLEETTQATQLLSQISA